MKANIGLVFVLFLNIGAQCQSTGSDPIVSTTNGPVRGQINATVEQGKPFCSFRGIPYAKPPVGNLRFKPPVPETPWQGTLDATKDGADCVQDGGGSEDCLFLNVYTPQIQPGQLLPVMCYIYGGGFTGGSSSYASYGPDYLLEKNVVVVTLNYRLGIFGFLSTNDLNGPGNMGLKDQVLALKWVKNNIAGFGGDPTQVTLFGQSSGSASTAYHIHSRLSQGLFQKAMMESGSSFSLWSYARNAKLVAETVAQNYGINTANTRTLVDGLRNIANATDLQATASAKALQLYITNDPKRGFAYAPVLEPEHDGAFQTAASYELMANGNFIQVPCLIGYNSLEGTFDFSLILRAFLLKYDATPQTFVPASMNVNGLLSTSILGPLIKLHYFGLLPIAISNQTLMQYISDDQFVRPIRQYALLLSRHVPTYYYRFSYMGRLSGFGPSNPRPGNGVAHGEELKYLWRSPYEPTLLDRVTRARMVTMWTNFAKYGNPTPSPDPILQNTTWPQTDEEHTYLDIGNDLVVANNPQAKDMNFWDDVFAKYGNRPYITY